MPFYEKLNANAIKYFKVISKMKVFFPWKIQIEHSKPYTVNVEFENARTFNLPDLVK
jgi:hypothetical protein